MKMALKRILVLTLALAMLAGCFVACDTNGNDNPSDNGNGGTPTETPSNGGDTTPTEKVTYTLNLSADKADVLRGDTVTLTAVLKAEGQEDLPSEDTEFILVNGAEYASISDNTLTVLSTAPDGATITVQAKEGASYSNTVTIKVSVPLNGITISAATNRPVAGQNVVITKVTDPTDATQTITWEIVEGSDIAVMAGDVLMVSANAQVGDVIKLRAVSGDVQSNMLEFTVKALTEDVKVNSIRITTESLNLLAGQSAIITVTVDPVNTTEAVTLAIVDGADYAQLVGNVLIISNTATAGTTIKVQATSTDGVKSNELVFTVRDNEVAIESVEIYANNNKPLPGQSVAISKHIEPANATQTITWVVVGNAVMVGDVLVVSTEAKEGDVITVKAVVGEYESNELEFVVGTSEIKVTKITLSADYFNLLPGQTMIIKSVVEPTGATEDVKLDIVEGKEYATLAGNVLIVSENAPAGLTIRVVAKSSSTNSNELEFTVRDTSKPATSVQIQADNTSPIAGHSVTIKYTIDPEDTTDKLSWVITQGEGIAVMAGNVLVVSADAKKGDIIKVKAVVGSIESEELVFTVRPAVEEIKVEKIEISANTEILAGSNTIINKIINPTDANQQIKWVITEGVNFATINGDTLIVSSEAKTGTVIKVKAVAGEGEEAVESNELIFTVQPSQEEINASRFYIDLSFDKATLDKKGNTAFPILEAEVYNYNYQKVEGKELEFKVIGDGMKYLSVTQNGDRCVFSSLTGHGTAVVEVRIKGTDVVATATINVIVPPDAIVLPEVFAERTDIDYSFSLLDHNISASGITDAGEATLPFVLATRGSALACKDFVVKFVHESGEEGNRVAVYDYETGEITFKKTGKITMTVTSNSGSKIEATTSYTFDINDGYNVNTFEELWLAVRSSKYNGQQINLVVLEKPDGSANNYEYGYDIVPMVSLKAKADQTIDEILRGPRGDTGVTSNRIQAVNKSLYLNGNSHTIDASQMRLFTEAEYDDYCERYGIGAANKITNVSSLLSAEPWNTGGDVGAGTNNKKTYSVNLYNVETKGNMPIDYDPTKYRNDGSQAMLIGGYTVGISIGQREYDCHYYIDADNLTSSGFNAGMNFIGVVGNGKVRNSYVYNCFSTGIFSRSNIMTFENIKFGPCGATGIELSSDECNEAGLNDNQVQQVTFAGTIDASTNVNDGNTIYFQNYNLGGATVPQIINGNVSQYHNNQISHIRNDKNQFIFVFLVFNDMNTFAPNTSEVNYPDGIIDLASLPVDGSVNTTHRFVRMPIMVTIPGLGTVNAGYALFYNHNYVG